MPTTGSGSRSRGGKGRNPRAASRSEPIPDSPGMEVVSEPEDDIESACGEDQFDLPVGDEPSSSRGKKRSYSSTEDTFGGEMQSLLANFGSDISKSIQAKRKRMENFAQVALKTSSKKIDQLWQSQQSERVKMGQEYQKQVTTVFSQWDDDIQKMKDSDEKLNNMYKQQQKLLQQQRVVQTQKIKTLKQLHEQYTKGMEELDSLHLDQTMAMQTELKKEMNALQKKILTDTHNQEISNVRRSLKTMLAQV